MDFQKVCAFALAEMRTTRRLVRYWCLISISYLAAVLIYLFYAAIHGIFSSYSATVALFNPRFLSGAIGLYCLLIFTAGAIFLGFDIRARDRQAQILEVLDSHSYTNLELISGKFVGLLIVTWIPIIILAILLQLSGLVLPSPFNAALEMHSLFTFIVLMALPALAFSFSIVFLATLLVKNRLISVALLLVLSGIIFQAIFNFPSSYSPLFDITGSWIINSPSEILPCFADFSGWAHRIGILAAALGIVMISAAVHPRLDGGSRIKTAIAGMAVLITSLGISGFVFYDNLGTINQIEAWENAHKEHSGITLPDLCSISGNISIDPGKNMLLDIDLTFRAPDHEAITRALFTLNPGQKIKKISDASGAPLSFTHENGLLEINLPAPVNPGDEKKISLSISGIPDIRFGYFYSAVNTEDMTSFEKNISMLGLEKSIFDSRYIALMPGTRWLPIPGTEKERNDPRKQKTDYFNVDLTVELPSGWIAAGPGKRIIIEEKGENRIKYRFSPGAPVPETALIASQFKSLSFDVEGITMELLMYPGHMKNVELFKDTGDEIQEWIKIHLKEAKEYGLEYPYNGLTLVEVPATLRGFGGGWRMDTTMSPPGMLLMRETSFPTACFEWPLRNPDKFKDKEGGFSQAKWEIIKTFFLNDMSGTHIFAGASRNFFLNQTSVAGAEATPLNYVFEDLSANLITETSSYFSAYNYTVEDVIGSVMIPLTFSKEDKNISGDTMTEAAIDILRSDSEVWDNALNASLIDMDLWKNPAQKISVLTIKAGAMSRIILDLLGRKKAGELLASLRSSYKGSTFSFNDMVNHAKPMDIDLNKLFKNMLNSPARPGFICTNVKSYRIPDTKDGLPRYQLLIDVRNDEKAPGMFYLRYRINSGDRQEWTKTKPVYMDGKTAVRIGIISSHTPDDVLLDPYISLNRSSFTIPREKVNHEKIINIEPFDGVKPLQWTEADKTIIIVDNLDESFKVIDGVQKKKVQKGRRVASLQLGE